MKKLQKYIIASGVSLMLFLPMVTVAVGSGSESFASEGEQLAQQSTTNIKGLTQEFAGKAGLGDEATAQNRSLPVIIGRIINAALGLLGIVMVVLVIMAGYKWMTAQGNSTQVDEAKKTITSAVIGMVILMASYAIARFVLQSIISGATGSLPENLSN